jgi:hypothetical protein
MDGDADGTPGAQTKEVFQEKVLWAEIGQLHGAVLEFSKQCLETKKLCVTVLAAVLGVFGKWGDGDPARWRAAAFVGFFVVFCFWCVDAHFYGLQRSLRSRMAAAVGQIAAVQSASMPEGSYLGRAASAGIVASLFNQSQLLYLLMGLTMAVLSLGLSR